MRINKVIDDGYSKIKILRGHEIIMKVLYVCERPYVLYKALLKAILNENNDEMDIIISNHMPGMEKILPYIESESIFNKVFFYDDDGYQEYVKNEKLADFVKFPNIMLAWPKKLARYFKYQKRALEDKELQLFNFAKYDDIMTNDGVSAIGFRLYHDKLYHSVSEHAKNNFKIKVRLHIFAVWCTVILDRLGIIPAYSGMSKYVTKIEVSEDKDLVNYIKRKEIVGCDVNSLERKLNTEQKNLLYSIYAGAYELPTIYDKPVDIILTTSLCKDGLVASEEEQFDCFKELIDEYADVNSHIVLIKPHPKDDMDYSGIKNCIVVNSRVSAEILNMSNSMRIESVVTICSTAVLSFNRAKRIIVVGPEYLMKFSPVMSEKNFESLKRTADEVRDKAVEILH